MDLSIIKQAEGYGKPRSEAYDAANEYRRQAQNAGQAAEYYKGQGNWEAYAAALRDAASYMHFHDLAMARVKMYDDMREQYMDNALSYYHQPHRVYRGSKPRGRNY